MSTSQHAQEPRAEPLTNRHRDEEDSARDPPYRRFGYETHRDKRCVSSEIKPLGRERIGRVNRDDQKEDQKSKHRQHRLYEAKSDSYDHHIGRSRAATRFNPKEADRCEQQMFERLKGWNDGTRDSDRQVWEGEADKLKWIESHGQRLSLPYVVIEMAKWHMTDLDDINRLGPYSGLHKAVLASLTRAYQGFWISRGYRQINGSDPNRWCEREDFRDLWEAVGFTEDDLRETAKWVGKKTDVSWPRRPRW